jgi:hypothetical protein
MRVPSPALNCCQSAASPIGVAHPASTAEPAVITI